MANRILPRDRLHGHRPERRDQAVGAVAAPDFAIVARLGGGTGYGDVDIVALRRIAGVDRNLDGSEA